MAVQTTHALPGPAPAVSSPLPAALKRALLAWGRDVAGDVAGHRCAALLAGTLGAALAVFGLLR